MPGDVVEVAAYGVEESTWPDAKPERPTRPRSRTPTRPPRRRPSIETRPPASPSPRAAAAPTGGTPDHEPATATSTTITITITTTTATATARRPPASSRSTRRTCRRPPTPSGAGPPSCRASRPVWAPSAPAWASPRSSRWSTRRSAASAASWTRSPPSCSARPPSSTCARSSPSDELGDVAPQAAPAPAPAEADARRERRRPEARRDLRAHPRRPHGRRGRQAAPGLTGPAPRGWRGAHGHAGWRGPTPGAAGRGGRRTGSWIHAHRRTLRSRPDAHDPPHRRPDRRRRRDRRPGRRRRGDAEDHHEWRRQAAPARQGEAAAGADGAHRPLPRRAAARLQARPRPRPAARRHGARAVARRRADRARRAAARRQPPLRLRGHLRPEAMEPDPVDQLHLRARRPRDGRPVLHAGRLRGRARRPHAHRLRRRLQRHVLPRRQHDRLLRLLRPGRIREPRRLGVRRTPRPRVRPRRAAVDEPPRRPHEHHPVQRGVRRLHGRRLARHDVQLGLHGQRRPRRLARVPRRAHEPLGRHDHRAQPRPPRVAPPVGRPRLELRHAGLRRLGATAPAHPVLRLVGA